MADNRRQGNLRHIFDTRGSVLAAWFISLVLAWPILCLFVATACLLTVHAILTMLYPGMEEPALGMIMSFVYLPLVVVASAVATAIACYATCRYLTAPWRESKPLAFELGTVMSVLIAIAAAYACWAGLSAWWSEP